MVKAFLGTKIGQSQVFTEDGKRLAVTNVQAGPCTIVQIKTKDSDGYWAIQLGFGNRKIKHLNKPEKGHLKKAGIEEKAPRFLNEVILSSEADADLKVGRVIAVDEVFAVGDKVTVSGISKGKGFAGVMKRHGFHGGPATHGQSDRSRAPGSIGATTTPGRVLKGKRMAGRMGQEKITVSGLKVVAVDAAKNLLQVRGLIPGPKKSLVTIFKI